MPALWLCSSRTAPPRLLNHVRFLRWADPEIGTRLKSPSYKAIFGERKANVEQHAHRFGFIVVRERKNQIVYYLVVLSTLLMAGLYALVIGWLLPKH